MVGTCEQAVDCWGEILSYVVEVCKEVVHV
jgi:hypothetical protein